MRFEFATAGRIIFGHSTIKEVAPLASHLGRRALVITGKNPARASWLIEQLQDHGIHTVTFQVPAEPTTDLAMEGATLARIEDCDLVVGMGGGSVIDTGKTIAALITNHSDLFNYLEVVGLGQEITTPPAPYIAIPTTAGTGTEVTKNSVLISPRHQVKVSMRSSMMVPRFVIIDPELTFSMSPSVTASTGLDALTQLIEAYVSRKANPLTDGICKEGLMRAARSVKKAYEDGNNTGARTDMAIASLFSGIALANAGLGAVHGFAAPLGGQFNAPHGVICARLLPFVMETNIHALTSREPKSITMKRFNEVAQILTDNKNATAMDGVSLVQELCTSFDIPPLAKIGLSKQNIPIIVDKAKSASSMKGNPVTLTDRELAAVLEKSL